MEQKSKLFSVDFKDAAKAVVMAGLFSAAQIIETSLDAGSLAFNWKAIGIAFVSGALVYLVKNFLTNNKDQILKASK